MRNWKETALIAAMCGFFTPADAATECSEWATMTQVLVIRWQGDIQFKGKTNEDVKAQLTKTMGGHPELGQAWLWVDYAYAHRKDNPVQVWKAALAECQKEAI